MVELRDGAQGMSRQRCQRPYDLLCDLHIWGSIAMDRESVTRHRELQEMSPMEGKPCVASSLVLLGAGHSHIRPGLTLALFIWCPGSSYLRS